MAASAEPACTIIRRCVAVAGILLVTATAACGKGQPQDEQNQTPAEKASAAVETETPATDTSSRPDAARGPLAQPLPRLLDLGATTCIPCKLMAPILGELQEEYRGRMEVAFIDVRKDPDLARQHRIQVIPTQIFYDASGTELYRHVGFISKEDILATWEKLGVRLG
jgi:thioredoxin 1